MNASATPTPDHAPGVVRLPAAVAARASLSPLEKSLLAHFLVLARPQIIVETGVYQAVTTEFMLEVAALNGLPSRLVGFDLPDVISRLREANEKIRQHERDGRLQLVEGLLPGSLRQWVASERPQVGFALIDAQHEFPHVTWELEALWPCLAPDGVILGHDYCAEHDGVRYAFDAFARKHGGHLLPLTSAGKAGAAEHRSSLVALRRAAYQPNAGDWLKHHGLGWKANLVRSRLLGGFWRNCLRPLLKGSQPKQD
jgi:predicted O-methyltransferase YrrM